MSALEGRPMMCPDQPDRQSVQIHRQVHLTAGVLIVGENVLLVSGPPIEEDRMLCGSGILDEVERMVLSSDALVGSWCFSDPFSWLELDWAGGHRHLMFGRSWSLPICQSTVTTTKISCVKILKGY